MFLALSLDDQLYDFTDDSFKAPALNTFSRTLELQAIASANHAAGIAKEALSPFVDELEWSVAKDPVLDPHQRDLCKLHIANIRENLGEADRIARGVSGLRMVMGDYFRLVTDRIRETIHNNPKGKQELSALAAAFIVQAETIGFPRRHSYHVTQNALIRHLKYEESFDPTTLLEDFFAGFPKERVKFNCLFLSEGDYERFPKVLSKFSITASTTPPTWENLSADQQSFIASRKETQFYLLVDDISARSPAQAHQIARELFAEFAGVVRFFEHKLTFLPTALSLVRDTLSKRVYRIHDAPDPMHCWVTHTSASESEILSFAAVTHGPNLTEVSAKKLRRAVRLHRSALLSTEAENQLIDLWAALEGLVARPGKESQRLQYFSECLLPSLVLTYPEKLFLSAYRDLVALAPKAHSVALSLPGDDSGFSKFIRLVLCSEHATVRKSFIELLLAFPLLLNKIWRLSEQFKDRASTQQTLRRHRQKVGWHLARIYHTRNSIMHSATALPHLSTLVENLHVYLDTLIRAVQKASLLSRERLSIDGALQYLAVWERHRLHAITHDAAPNDSPPNDRDVWAVVFGDRLALAPDKNNEPSLPAAR